MAATVGGLEKTNSAASAVVMCSITTFRSGRVCTKGVSTLWMNTFSLSKKSILGSVTSPCTSSNIPSCNGYVFIYRSVEGSLRGGGRGNDVSEIEMGHKHIEEEVSPAKLKMTTIWNIAEHSCW